MPTISKREMLFQPESWRIADCQLVVKFDCVLRLTGAA